MSDFNIGSDWKTKVAKGNILENEYVKVYNHGDWETYLYCKNRRLSRRKIFKNRINWVWIGLWMSEGLRMVNFNKYDSTINNTINDICFDENDRVIFGSND